MASQHDWDNKDKTCYHIEFSDGWQWEEWSRIHRDVYDMLKKWGKTTDLIVSFHGKTPGEGGGLSHIRTSGTQPTNIRHTVMVTKPDQPITDFMQDLIGTWMDILDWVGPKFVNSMDEARIYLAELNQE